MYLYVTSYLPFYWFLHKYIYPPPYVHTNIVDTSINRKLELNILRSKKIRIAKTLITGEADKGIGREIHTKVSLHQPLGLAFILSINGI